MEHSTPKRLPSGGDTPIRDLVLALADELGKKRNSLLVTMDGPGGLMTLELRLHDPALFAQSETTFRQMATAPKDGTEVLLRVKSRAGAPGKMLVGHFMPGGHCIEDHPPIDQGWYFWNGCMFDRAAEPTAWMPLPQEPK